MPYTSVMRPAGVIIVAIVGCSTTPPTTLIAPIDTQAWSLVVDEDSAWIAGTVGVSADHQTLSYGILRVSLDGGSTSVVAQQLAQDQVGDVDAIYFSTVAADAGAVMRLPKDGGAVQQLATTGTSGPAIAVDDAYVYWLDQTGFMRVSKAGGQPETLTQSQIFNCQRLLVDSANLYWTTASLDDGGVIELVERMPKTGGAIEVLTTTADIDTALAIDDNAIYWTTSSSSIVRLDKATKQISAISTGAHSGSESAIVVDSARAYWINSSNIYDAPLDGGAEALLTQTRGPSPADLFVEPMTLHNGVIFWIDYDHDSGAALRHISTP